MAYLTNDSVVSRIYSNFRGVDFRGEEINLSRSPDSLNMWKDYKETESIRTRPKMELDCDLKNVHSISFFQHRDGEDTIRYALVHAEDALYRVEDGEAYLLRGGLGESVSQSFVYDGKWYFKDGINYLVYNGEHFENVVDLAYVPTTTIGRKPMGGGTKYEEVNMLSPYRKNSFLADGGSFDFFLDTMNIDVSPVGVTYNGESLPEDEFEVDYAEGKITFLNFAPDAPLTDGQDNVVVEFKKTVPGYAESILNCTMLQVFDNRVFFSGNPDHPNTVWHCSLNDPSYVSDLDYYREGMDESPVRGMVAGNNALWVFREPSSSNTTVFYHTPTLDEQYGKIYPSSHSSVTTGCIGKAINFNDDIVFFSERGMEGISGDVTTEQVLAHRSSMVDRKLTAEPNYKDMILEEWEGYLLVFIDNKVYIADSRATFANGNHTEYEWFYWEMDKKVTCSCVKDGVLYLGTEDGVYTLTDTESALESYWVTPLDKFKHPHKLKTTNKRGCVCESEGDISLYAKLEDTDFELIGTYENVTDYFVSRIKRKKFKDLQLKFYSSTRFSLETMSIEAFIGGYIKR